MMKARLLLLMAAGLTACAAQAQDTDRVIQVQVVGGKIQVPEQVAQVNRSHGAIRWQLGTPGHTFPADGIVIKEGGGAFQNCKPMQQGTVFKCARSGHVAGKRYKYDVNVNQGGTALPTLDPFIQNE